MQLGKGPEQKHWQASESKLCAGKHVFSAPGGHSHEQEMELNMFRLSQARMFSQPHEQLDSMKICDGAQVGNEPAHSQVHVSELNSSSVLQLLGNSLPSGQTQLQSLSKSGTCTPVQEFVHTHRHVLLSKSADDEHEDASFGHLQSQDILLNSCGGTQDMGSGALGGQSHVQLSKLATSP